MNITTLSKKVAIIALFGILLYTVSCNDKSLKPQFTIEGTIENAADSLYLYLEKRSLTENVIIDSVKLNSDGSFKIMHEAPEQSEFYQLQLDGQKINLVIDSTETIEIKTSKPTFATEYSISGSEESNKIKIISLAAYKVQNQIKDLNKRLMQRTITESQYLQSVKGAVDGYRTDINLIIQEDFGSFFAYYALFQRVGDYLIYDPASDLRMFQAVANAWITRRSEHPRTQNLKEFVLSALAERAQAEKDGKHIQNIGIQEAGSDYFNISLPNALGENIELSSLKGKIVILDFTLYQADYSPARNILLKDAYKLFKNKIEIYQVSFDVDKHVWQNIATNQPWVCVWDEDGPDSGLLDKFNIQNLPTSFILDSKGNIIKRLVDGDDLGLIISKIL
mgnify:CR=1 FL=1